MLLLLLLLHVPPLLLQRHENLSRCVAVEWFLAGIQGIVFGPWERHLGVAHLVSQTVHARRRMKKTLSLNVLDFQHHHHQLLLLHYHCYYHHQQYRYHLCCQKVRASDQLE